MVCRNKAKKAAAAVPLAPLALPCAQIKRQCGKCHQIRWLERRPPKTAAELEEDDAKRKKKKDEACRLEAAADDKIKFMCRHDVDDEVTRPPCLLIVCCAEWCW